MSNQPMPGDDGITPDGIEANENSGPLGQFLGDTDKEFELEFAKPRPKLTTYQIMIGAVVLMSGGAIYGMRAYGMNKGIDFTGTEITVPEGASTADRESFEVVLARFDRSDRPVQVPIDLIGKDPFSLGEFASKKVASNTDPDELARQRAMEEAQRQFEERQREIESALTAVQVQSLMGGRNPVASINGKLYSIGEVVNDILTVHRIDTGSVTFEVDGELYEIGVGERYGEKEG